MADILDVIDGALADYDTSGDAMRWNPEPPRVICDGGDVLWPERRWYDTAGNWYGLEDGALALGRFCEGFATQVLPVLAHAFSDLTAAFNRSAQPFIGLLALFRDVEEHHRAELSRMHREYRRRSNARRRRRRK